MEEALHEVIRTIDNSDASPHIIWQLDHMAPERSPVRVKMVEYDVNGFTGILGGAAFRAAIAQGIGQGIERFLNIFKFCHSMFD
jgi:hypothetical protein